MDKCSIRFAATISYVYVYLFGCCHQSSFIVPRSDELNIYIVCLQPTFKHSPEPTQEVAEEKIKVEPMEQEETVDEKKDLLKLPLEGIDEGSQPLPGLDFAPSLEELAGEHIKKEPNVEEEKAQEQDQSEGNNAEGDSSVKQEEMEGMENDDEQKTDQDLNDTIRAAEQSVVIEEIAEFGVDPAPAPVEENSMDHEDATTQDSVSNGVVPAEAGKGDDGDRDASQGEFPSKPISPQGLSNSSETPDQSTVNNSLKVLKGSGGFVLKVKQTTLTNGADAKAASEQRASRSSDVGVDEHDDDVGHENADDEQEWIPPPSDPAFKNLPTVRRGVEESGLCSIM